MKIYESVAGSISANRSESKRSRRNITFASAASLFAFAAMPGTLHAQAAANSEEAATPGEIIVTAQRRNETILSTPLSVSAVSGAAISQTARTDINSILEQVPSVQYQTAPDGLQVFAIRGIGTDGPNKEPSVAQYYDGVVQFRQTNAFHDLARIEVLRGPQGTLYGGSATGGAINVITNDPKLNQVEAFGQAGYGNYDALNLQGMVNVPLGDTVGLRVSGQYNRRDTYYGNGDTARNGYNIRAKLRYHPSENFNVVVGGEFSRELGIGDGQAPVDPATGKPTSAILSRFGFNDIQTYKVFARADLDLDFATLTYIPAYQHRTVDNGTYLAGAAATGGAVPSGKVLTQELRLASSESSPIKWLVGGYYYKLDQSYFVYVSFFSPALPVTRDIVVDDPQHNYQVAGFGQVTVPISDTLRLTGGLRYSTDHINHKQQLTIGGFPTPPVAFERTYHKLDYLVRGEANLGPDTIAYATISSGYRPGNTAVGGQSYDNESVTAYEAGVKTRLLDNALSLSAAAFYNDYGKYQVTSSINCGPNCSLANVSAIPTKMAGFELEAQVRPSPFDTFEFNASYLDSKFKGNVSITPVLGGPTTTIATANALIPHAPKWRINANYQHDFDIDGSGKIFVRGELSYVSAQILDFSGCYYSAGSCTAPNPFAPADTRADFVQTAYTLINASIGYTTEDKRFSVVAYGRNLGDERYKVSYQSPNTELAQPRTYGVTVSVRW